MKPNPYPKFRYVLIIGVLFFLFACQYPKQHIGIVHDYVIHKANEVCSTNDGLHYIVPNMTIYQARSAGWTGDFNDYPCKEVFKIRCQNGALFEVKEDIGFCFIPEDQIMESL